MKIKYLLALTVFIAACGKSYTPRPYGFFRITFPNHVYEKHNAAEPYLFEINRLARVSPDSSEHAEPFWVNVEYPQYKASIHISFKTIDGNIAEVLEDTRTLAYKHAVKADAIEEEKISDVKRNVHGLVYNIKGNAASPIQFFLTDSVKHYLRGALYFNVPPNKDSLAPVVEYIKKDVRQLINTLEWRK